MNNEYLIIIGIILFFFGIGAMVTLMDTINTYLDNCNSKKTFREVTLIPSGEILKISEYEFQIVSGELVIWNNQLKGWIIEESSYYADKLRENQSN